MTPEQAARLIAIQRRRWKRQPGKIITTGIRAIDLLCTVEKGACVVVLGGPGAGRFSAVRELCHRLKGTKAQLTIVYGIVPHDGLLLKDELEREHMLRADRTHDYQLIWLPLEDAKVPEASIAEVADMAMFFNPILAFRGQFPALDATHSWSHAHMTDAGSRQRACSGNLREVLVDAEPQLSDPTYLRCVALGWEREAHARWRELVGRWRQERPTSEVATALRIGAFLTQPFFTAQSPDGRSGEATGMDETLGQAEQITMRRDAQAVG